MSLLLRRWPPAAPFAPEASGALPAIMAHACVHLDRNERPASATTDLRRLSPERARVGELRYARDMHVVHNEAMSDEPHPAERLPDAEHLLTLLAVADAGNESAAAEVLGVGQSSINRRLAGLQQQSDLPLTKRTAAGTRLTPAGAALLPYARHVREALRSAARLLAPADSAPLRVKLGMSPHLTPRLAGGLAAASQAEEPLDISYQEADSTELLAAVRAARLDAAISLWAPAGTEPGLSAHRLGSDRVVLVVPAGSGHLAAGRADAALLRRSTLLLPGPGTVSDRGRAFARMAGIDEAGLVELSGPAAVRAAVLAGRGVGVLLASYVAAETAAAWLVAAALSGVLAGGGASGPDEPATGDEAQVAGLDEAALWLLTNDALPDEAARRLTALSQRTVDDTRLR